ncbi:hypothetical protein [Microvirga puerhi]|uniref:DUF3106 domain-containing protein n=1 Tax=Microvirga puerhi TaxID=2876078 RepID=A0ABS7VNR2_9HYPH|nr:hypothetical protein [Microvirga puerhi]MBZ6077179.1 hypothetical protein [Microvirga puerhi]
MMARKDKTMTGRAFLAIALVAGFMMPVIGNDAAAMPLTSLEPQTSLVQPIQMGFLELFADDDEYVHNRHYDWEQYRNSTSRKERIRDYYRMQRDAEKDYWKAQKQMQKEMVKRQRGW